MYVHAALLSLSILVAIFPGGHGLAGGTRMSPFWILFAVKMLEVMMTTGAIKRAKLLSSRHHQQTNTLLVTGRKTLPVTNQQ